MTEKPLSEKAGEYGAFEGKDVAEHILRLKEELFGMFDSPTDCQLIEEKIDKIMGEFHSPHTFKTKGTIMRKDSSREDTHARQVGPKEGCGKVTEINVDGREHKCGEDDWLCPKCKEELRMQLQREAM